MREVNEGRLCQAAYTGHEKSEQHISSHPESHPPVLFSMTIVGNGNAFRGIRVHDGIALISPFSQLRTLQRKFINKA